MEEPDTINRWSVKDVVGHVTTWEEEIIKRLGILRRGEERPSYGDFNVWNEQQVEIKRALSLSQVLEQLQLVHTQLVTGINEFTDEVNTGDVSITESLRVSTSEHYREHAEDISAWRKATGT